MSNILVAGLINIETTLQVEKFPIPYFPVSYPFFGVGTTVSGVGYNLAKAFTNLGHRVDFLSMIGPGEEFNAQITRRALEKDGLSGDGILNQLSETPQSVILYEPNGRREIYTDLKDIQETSYPLDVFEQSLQTADLVALCNINFARPMLEIAKRSGKLVATDVHVLSDPFDRYNADYMRAADILFLSDEGLPTTPEAFIRHLYSIYHNEVIVIGQGSNGALLYEGRNDFLIHVPAVKTRSIVNTIGAGDALFTAFCHGYIKTRNSLKALQAATVFASFKIGVASASEGYLNDQELQDWTNKLYGENAG